MTERETLIERCDHSMLLAIRHHYKLPPGNTSRDRALTEAANYAAVAAALRATKDTSL